MAEDLDKQTREAFSPSTKATEAFGSAADRTREAVRGADSPRSRENIPTSEPYSDPSRFENWSQEQLEGSISELGLSDERAQGLREEWARANEPDIVSGMRNVIPDAPQGRERTTFFPMNKPQGMSAWEALRSGNARLDWPGAVGELPNAAMDAATAPSRATVGAVSDPVGEALNTAGLMMGSSVAATRPPNSLGLFAGPNAANAPIENLNRVNNRNRLFTDSPKTLGLEDTQLSWQEKGWEVDPYSKSPMWEISPVNYSVRENIRQVTPNELTETNMVLGDVIDFPEMYEAYPQLKDVPVTFTSDSRVAKVFHNGRTMEPVRFVLPTEAVNEGFKLDDGSRIPFEELVYHELQHAVDGIEGRLDTSYQEVFETLPEIMQLTKDYTKIANQYEDALNRGMIAKQGYDNLMADLDSTYNTKRQNLYELDPDEVRANAAASRLYLTPKERSEMRPTDSYLMGVGGANFQNYTRPRPFNEGGSVERDPVSGNEVPPGSEPHNVRDDIPAMLSEGEFVIPANVVNYYGVSKFDKMIDDAEAKLEEMDQKGRIGGEDDGMFLGGLFGGSRNSNNSSNYPWSNVEVAQAPLFDMYQWIFPGISAFWETTATKPRSAPSKEKPEDKIKWIYQTPEREEGGGSVDPNSNLWTMDKGKFRQIASTGRFNPLDNLFGRLGENFRGIASQSRKSYLRAALEVAKERGMDQDIVSGLEQKLESLGGYQEVEGEDLVGREGSRLSEITGPARWEQVYNYHSAQAGRETIPDPKNPYTAPSADRPQRAGGPAMPGSLGERINQRIDQTVERITGNPVVDDVLTTVGSPSGGGNGETPQATSDIGGGFSGRYPVVRSSMADIDALRAAGVEPNFETRLDPNNPETGETVYALEINPNTYNVLESLSDQLDPNKWNAVRTLMNESMARGVEDYRPMVGGRPEARAPAPNNFYPDVINSPYNRIVENPTRGMDQYVPATQGRPTTPEQPDNFYGPEWESLNRNMARGRDQYVPATRGRPTTSMVIDGVDYSPVPDLPRTRTIDPNIRQGDRGIDWAERTQGFPTDVYNRGYQEPPKKYESAIDQQIAEALGDVARNVKERLTSIRGVASSENRPDDFLAPTMKDQMDAMLSGENSRPPVDWDAIGERAAREERGGEPVVGFSGEGEGPTQTPNPQPYNERSPTQEVNIENNSGGNAPPQEDYDDEGTPFYKGGYVQRPVSYAKGGYVTRKKGK